MLPVNHRLPPQAFAGVFKNGKRTQSEDVTLITAPSKENASRFAIVVSTKIAKRAVERNRMKRLVREAVFHLLPTIQSGIDCLIIARKNFSQKKEVEMEHIVRNLISKHSL